MDEGSAAAAESIRRKVNRAGGLLREAGRDLASLAVGQDFVGVVRCCDPASRADASALIQGSVARYGAVDVIVVSRPTGRFRRSTPTTAHEAKENTNGTQEHAIHTGSR